MIEYIPLFTIVFASIYLFLKAFDYLLETVIYFHSLHVYRLIFDDYEAELSEAETDADSDALKELKAHLELDLSQYRSLVVAHPWKYRLWRTVSSESYLVRAVECVTNDKDSELVH